MYSGTLVVRGRGVAEVRSTGARTAIGRIGESLKDRQPEPRSRVERRGRDASSRWWPRSGLGLCVVLVSRGASSGGEWVAGVLAGITLAMATLPEEFPLVLTVFLVLGAWRMSKSKVLTRRSAAIEALGAATVLCTDKTGTLTVEPHDRRGTRGGRGALDAGSGGGRRTAGSDFTSWWSYRILASRPDPFDPMERAFPTSASSS